MSLSRMLLTTLLVGMAVFAWGLWLSPTRVPLSIPVPSADPFESASTASTSPSNAGDPFAASESSSSPNSEPLLTGIDLDGRLHRLGETPDCRAVVLVFLATECPIARSVIPRLNQLAQVAAAKHVEFYGVLSSQSVTRPEAKEFVSEFSVAFPVLFDTSLELRERLQITHTPQAVVLSADGECLYRGAIDDQYPSVTQRRPEPSQHFLRDAIERVLNSPRESIELMETPAVGCLVERPSASHQVTFCREIAPILYRHCATCHRPGAVAPFALERFEDIRGHAAQIKAMVELELMPPWQPRPGTERFRDELRLSSRQRALIAEWINSDMPYGDVANLPPLPTYPDGWQLGEPDLIVQVPEPFAVPADGPDIYQYFVLPTGLTSDRLVSAIEYRASNPRVVHHASFRFDDAGHAKRLDDHFPGPGYRHFGGWGFETGGTLGGWAVGVLPQRFPTGWGRPLKANSDLVLQTHYHPSGKPESDQATVGLYFAPPEARQRIGELIVANRRLSIPPHESRFRHSASYTLPVDVTLHSVLPHTHLLGRELTAFARYPHGRRERLIHIDDWRFNWQGHYFYRQPVRLPRGTVIEFDVVFDNSDANPLNPFSPPRHITWGESTSEEMAVCFFDVSTDTAADLDHLLTDNRQALDRHAVE